MTTKSSELWAQIQGPLSTVLISFQTCLPFPAINPLPSWNWTTHHSPNPLLCCPHVIRTVTPITPPRKSESGKPARKLLQWFRCVMMATGWGWGARECRGRQNQRQQLQILLTDSMRVSKESRDQSKGAHWVLGSEWNSFPIAAYCWRFIFILCFWCNLGPHIINNNFSKLLDFPGLLPCIHVIKLLFDFPSI